jgi:hypothetical protein
MTYSEECDELQAKVDNVPYNDISTYIILKLIATILIAIYRRMGHI